MRSEFGWLLSGPITSTGDQCSNGISTVGTHLVISGGMEQFMSPNEEIIDAFRDIWGCDSKEPISSSLVILHLTENAMK